MITEYISKATDKWKGLNKKGKTIVVAVAVIIVIALVQAV